jgi:hypothetical protein
VSERYFICDICLKTGRLSVPKNESGSSRTAEEGEEPIVAAGTGHWVHLGKCFARLGELDKAGKLPAPDISVPISAVDILTKPMSDHARNLLLEASIRIVGFDALLLRAAGQALKTSLNPALSDFSTKSLDRDDARNRLVDIIEGYAEKR